MKKAGLPALLAPRAYGECLGHFRSNEPFLAEGLKASFRPLTCLPLVESLERLFTLWPNPVQAHLPKVADEASSVDVAVSDARKLFDNGMGLLFDHAQNQSSVLKEWLEAIREDLGLSALTESRCLIYATPGGKGTAPHFDQNINFVLQIHGKKRWFLAPNRHVENPLSRHTMGLPPDPELATYAQLPLPAKMPAESRSFDLEPGSLLFVPRGMWHSTKADTDALSLNFTYSAPSWLDLLTAALRSRLALSSQWRETAVGVSGPDRSLQEVAVKKFDTLLSELTLDLPHWTASEILRATE